MVTSAEAAADGPLLCSPACTVTANWVPTFSLAGVSTVTEVTLASAWGTGVGEGEGEGEGVGLGVGVGEGVGVGLGLGVTVGQGVFTAIEA
jgi:hypothetical protein